MKEVDFETMPIGTTFYHDSDGEVTRMSMKEIHHLKRQIAAKKVLLAQSTVDTFARIKQNEINGLQARHDELVGQIYKINEDGNEELMYE